MKQTIIGAVVFIFGLILLVFATMFGLVVGMGMLLASPFIKRKLKNIKIQQEKEMFSHPRSGQSTFEQNNDYQNTDRQNKVIEGDFKDITDK